MSNTWPGGHRHAMSQSDHRSWNANNYPGTRQLCDRCGGETERCEDDTIYSGANEDVLCLDCYDKEMNDPTIESLDGIVSKIEEKIAKLETPARDR